MGVQFKLNGKMVESAASPASRLLDVVRNEFGLTGAKCGCKEGECGACSVLLDGLLVNSCMVAIGTLYTGPSVAQGTAGTWFASGQVTVGSSGGGDNFDAILWDGTTVIDSCRFTTTSVSGGYVAAVTLSGVLANPAGNIRISVRCGSRTDNTINYNASSYTKDSTLTAIRIA